MVDFLHTVGIALAILVATLVIYLILVMYALELETHLRVTKRKYRWYILYPFKTYIALVLTPGLILNELSNFISLYFIATYNVWLIIPLLLKSLVYKNATVDFIPLPYKKYK